MLAVALIAMLGNGDGLAVEGKVPAPGGSAGTLPGGPCSENIVIQPPYDASYSCFSLGSVPGLPPNYGGLTFLAGDNNTILIGGTANTTDGALYTIGVVRDGTGHITGFTGEAVRVADGAYNDGGVVYGPDGVLFLARWPENSLGETKPGSSITDKTVLLNDLVCPALSALNFVPAGFPGAGELKFVTYSGGCWYTVGIAPDGNGTFDVTSAVSETTITGGPEGFIYVPPGSPVFPDFNAMLIAEYAAGSIATYNLDENGDPNPDTRATFISGLSGAEGTAIDPVTGDFLFSTFGGGNQVIAIRGFAAPPAPSVTPTVEATATATASPETVVPTATATSAPPTSTATSIPSTATSIPPTATALPSTATRTPTQTRVPTSTPPPSATPSATFPPPATSTFVFPPTLVPTSTLPPPPTPAATATSPPSPAEATATEEAAVAAAGGTATAETQAKATAQAVNATSTAISSAATATTVALQAPPTPTRGSNVLGEVTPPNPPGGSGGSQVPRASFGIGAGEPKTTGAIRGFDQVSKDPKVIGTNIVLAIILLIVLLVSSTVFNEAVSEHRVELQATAARLLSPFHRLGARLSTLAPAGLDRGPLALLVGPIAMLGVTALVYSFNEPHLAFDGQTALLYSSLLVSIAVITYIVEGGEALMTHRRFGLTTGVRLVPIAIVIAAGFVIMSRLVHFQAPIMYGFIASATVLGAAGLERKDAATAVVVPAIALLAASIGAWLLLPPLRDWTQHNHNWWSHVPSESAAAVFVGGIEGLMFVLLPLRFTDGEKIFRWYRWLWFPLFGVSAFLFCWVVLNPQARAFDSLLEGRVVFIACLVAAYAIVAMGFWAYFWQRSRRHEAANVT